MSLKLYSMAGSPYAWRVALALETKRIPYEQIALSYDAGDFKKPLLASLNPRRRVPVLVDGDFTLYESAAIVEYIEDRWPDLPRLFSRDVRRRATERRMIREADQYFAAALEKLVEAVFFTPPDKRSPPVIRTAWEEMRTELARWEDVIADEHLAGGLSAADFTLYPLIALGLRIVDRNPGIVTGDLMGPRLSKWASGMRGLAIVEATWPPHWRS